MTLTERLLTGDEFRELQEPAAGGKRELVGSRGVAMTPVGSGRGEIAGLELPLADIFDDED